MTVASKMAGTLPNGQHFPPDIPSPPTISFRWEWIDAGLAEEYLKLNFDRNRRQREKWIIYLAQQMEKGSFFPSHQGIAFDEEGFLLDGQHRLAAIDLSGKGQWIIVARGVPRANVLAMDRHARRTEPDQIRVAYDDMTATTRDVAIARMMVFSYRGSDVRLDGQDLVAFLRRHHDAIRFALHHNTRRKTSSSPIRSVVARAYYHVTHERLDEFLCVLDTGEAQGPADFAAIRLRNAMENAYLASGNTTARNECMLKTISALRAFVERRPIENLYAAKTDPYPLPQ